MKLTNSKMFKLTLKYIKGTHVHKLRSIREVTGDSLSYYNSPHSTGSTYL